MKEGRDFVEAYLNWLREKITFEKVDDYTEITTPFLDSHNDYIQLYLKQENDRIVISDDGYTISDLIMSGCDLTSKRRKDILQGILNGFGVKQMGKELVVEANEKNYPQKKHALLQAVISVGDMFMLAQSRVSSVFLEDVEVYFNQNDVRFTPSVQFTGKSGFQHTYDFVIPASKQKPERLIRAINTPTREKTEAVLFSWSDTRDMRKNDSSMYVFLNDSDQAIRSGVEEAFLQYAIHPIVWSKREKAICDLAA
ncbi:MAG: DUF1829 domain-containing protein [Clostridiales Family XIII bacterium]|jgi:hypothetical protein|nr:DUF1829 domain-containing protein [Clostridiales Family XIII bacterium]